MVGREYEEERLKHSLKSEESELIAVHGRRRVGKTYLIRHCFAQDMIFEMTGLYNGSRTAQLTLFFKEIKNGSNKFSDKSIPTNWDEAFDLLKTYIQGLRSKRKKVIFFDEFPWIDTHKSGFLMYFAHFWNTFCEKRKDLVVVVCGSAAAYMVQHIVSERGSLHARLSYQIRLKPFSLHETQRYLESRGIHWSHYTIIHLYIAIGGIPHYLSKIQKGKSVVQNIQHLCFDSEGDLVNEFEEIFKSLFVNSDTHTAIVRSLGTLQRGILRDELIKKTKFSGGGHFSKALNELIASGFVSEYQAIGKKKKMTLFRLSDEYSRFYLKYIEPNKHQGQHFWKTMSQQQSYITWAGFNFETICLKHIAQIKRALKIEGVHSTHSSWSTTGAQVDLVIARNDNWINLCEIKFYNREFLIGAKEVKNLRNKINLFKSTTKTKDVVVLTVISTYGLVENEHSDEIVEDSFTMDILFEGV